MNPKQITRKLIAVTVFLFFLATEAIVNTSPVYAEVCSQSTQPGWYPTTYYYSSSFVVLSGQTYQCWEGQLYQFRGISYGSQYPGQPLSRIKTTVYYWEEADGPQCTPTSVQDSGWLYNVYVATAFTQWRTWQCTGTTSHYYVAATVHYFGESTMAVTGHK